MTTSKWGFKDALIVGGVLVLFFYVAKTRG